MSAKEIPAAAEPRWMLLIHQIPPKPDYLRVKIGRRLQQIGAVPVKNSVYVLPSGDQAFEDFQWIRQEIVAGRGDASICRAGFIDGLTDDQIRQLFQSARVADYAEIAVLARELGAARVRRRGSPTRAHDELARLRKRLAAVIAIDFFHAPERALAREALDLVAADLESRKASPAAAELDHAQRASYRGRTWVTRQGIFVDRIASAWLIRRFIDREARFKFVAPAEYRPARGELRFDMFDAEFTHEGERCTFESLLERFALTEPALGALAEIVHDIDLKDAKFEREEAPGIERVLAGIACAHVDDETRLERGCQLFDELYLLFSSSLQSSP